MRFSDGSENLTLCDWKIRSETGEVLPEAPTFSICDIRIGPSPSQPIYEMHATNTIGSDIAWMDEWLFDATTRKLKSLIWEVPDLPLTSMVHIPETTPRTIQIQEMGGDIGGANYRHFTPERLICLEKDGADIDLCLNIAPDLDVLFAAKQWCGWRLRNPLLHLPHGPAPEELGACLALYYDLVSDDTLDDLFEREATLFEELGTLLANTKKIDHAAARYAATFFAEQIDRFYPDGKIGRDD